MRGEQVAPVAEDTDSAEFSEWAHSVYRDNEVRKLFRELLGGKFDRNNEWQYGRLTDGAASVKIYPVRWEDGEDLGRVRSLKFAGYSFENAWPIPHPDDSDYIAAVIEARSFGEKTAYRMWNHEGFTWVDSGLRRIETPPGAMDPEDIDLGMPPFAFLGDGQGWMGDAVIDQRAAINQYSSYEFIKAAQGSALGVLQGDVRNKPKTTDDGQRRIAVGDIDFLWLDEEGSFDWKSPQAQLDHHLEGIQQLLSQSYKSHGLPDDLIRESSGTEKPLAMLFRWLPAMTQRKNLLPEAYALERQAASVMSAYAEVYADDLQLEVADRRDVGFDVAFTDNPLPQDNKEHEESLRSRLKDGMILTTEYIYQMDPELSAQEIAEKAFALDREQTRRRKAAPPATVANGDGNNGGEPADMGDMTAMEKMNA
jgi:hypothetical protein